MTRLRGCSCSYSDGIIDEVEDIMSDLPTADVVEREKIDKAIEDIKNIDLIVHDGINHYYKSGEEVKAEVLVILKRNIGESEGKKEWS